MKESKLESLVRIIKVGCGKPHKSSYCSQCYYTRAKKLCRIPLNRNEIAIKNLKEIRNKIVIGILEGKIAFSDVKDETIDAMFELARKEDERRRFS